MSIYSKSWKYSVLIIPIVLLIVLGCGNDGDKTGSKVIQTAIDFKTDYESALAIGKTKNQDVLIDFFTDWCTWCKTLDTVTYVDSAVIAYSEKIVFVKIDAEVDTATARKYSVRSFPSIVLMKNDGTEIDRIAGYLPPEEFIQTIDEYLQGIGTLDYYLAIADTNSSPEINCNIGGKYSDRGNYEKAEEYYSKVIKDDPDGKDGYTAEAILSLGEVFRRTKEYDNAVVQYKKILKKFSDDENVADAEILIAVAYHQNCDTVKAITAYEDFMKNNPESGDTTYAKRQIDKLKNSPSPEEEG